MKHAKIELREITHPESPAAKRLIAQCSKGSMIRRGIEIAIVKRLFDAFIAEGSEIVADNGESVESKQGYEEFLETMFACDEASMIIYNKKYGPNGMAIFLVYGNEGWDVVSDYAMSLEPVMGEFLEWTGEEQIALESTFDELTMSIVKIEMITKWAKASLTAAKYLGYNVRSERYTEFERMFILSLVSEETGIELSKIKTTQLPPVVGMCFLSGRPLSSVLCVENPEAARLAGNNNPR